MNTSKEYALRSLEDKKKTLKETFTMAIYGNWIISSWIEKLIVITSFVFSIYSVIRWGWVI